MNTSSELTADLDRITRSAHQAADPTLRPVLMRIAQQARDRLATQSLQSSSDFFRRVGQCQLRIKGLANAEWRLETLFHCCHYLFLADEAGRAMEIAKHCVDLSRKTRRREDQRRFLNILGIVQGECGREAEAVESYAQSLAIAQELGHELAVFGTLVNLSSVLVNSGLYAEAIGCAQQALSVRENLTHEQMEAGAALTNIALALHYLGDQRRARAVAYRAVASAKLPTDNAGAMSRLAREQNLVMILIRLGEYEEARARCRIMDDLVTRVSSHRARAISAIAHGIVEVHCGNADRGLSMIREVASDAKVRNSPLRGDALAVLAAALGALERPEEALEAIQELRSYLEGVRLFEAVRTLELSQTLKEVPSSGSTSNHREHQLTEAKLRARVAEREVLRSHQEMLERMAVAADIREDISGEHSYRVGRLSSLLAKEIGWDRDACIALEVAARLHDIGKIGIPEKILLDEKTLKEAEKHFIASHTLIGAEILSKSDIPQVRIAEEIARCHHEWWDGTGYPRQLKSMAIPKGARIVALADAFDAMTHGRPYAKAVPVEAALNQIAILRGRQFDPELTDHFLALVRRLVATNEDLDGFLGKAARNSPFLKARARIKEMLAQGRDSTTLSVSPLPPGTTLN